MSDDPDLERDREVAKRIVQQLDGLDGAEAGFCLAYATAAWLRAGLPLGDDVPKDIRLDAYMQLLQHHVEAVIRLAMGPPDE